MRSRIAVVTAGLMVAGSMALAVPALAQNGQNGNGVDWDGAYSGLSGGGAGLGSDGGAGVPGFTTQARDRSTSLIGGALAGINFGGGGFVFGLEGDFSFLNAKTNGRFDNPFLYDADNSVVQARWLATVRARVGVPLNNLFLLYVTGGLALADVTVKETLGVPSRTVVSEVTPGWALGGGVEYKLSRNLSLRAEYLHAEMNEVKGRMSDSGAGMGIFSYTHRAEPTFNIGRAALSFRF